MLLNPERLSNPQSRAGRQRPAFFYWLPDVHLLKHRLCHSDQPVSRIARQRLSQTTVAHLSRNSQSQNSHGVTSLRAVPSRVGSAHLCPFGSRLATSEKCRADIGGMTGHLPEDPDFRLLPSGPAKSRSKGALFGFDPDCGRETDFWMASAILILSPLLQTKKRSKQ